MTEPDPAEVAGGTPYSEPSSAFVASLRRHALKLAVAGAFMAAATSGFLLGHEGGSSERHSDAPDVEHFAPLKPYTFIGKTARSAGEVRDEVFAGTYGYDTTGVTKPTEDDQLAFFWYYNPIGRAYTQYPLPRVRELISINNRRLFAQELKASPRAEPFDIFNATSQPVDVRFIRFALHATKHWLNDRTQQDDTINIGDHTQVKVRAIKSPHSMVITDDTPDFLKHWDQPPTSGTTTVYAGLTVSFIMKHYAYGDRTHLRKAMATEICQALVDVQDPKPIIGGQANETAFREKVSGFNPPARHDLDLASQESVCNGLGRVITTAYQDGKTASAKLPDVDKIGLQQIPWIDYRIYDADIPAFVSAGRRIHEDDNYTLTTRSSKSPTVRYYRHHEPAP